MTITIKIKKMNIEAIEHKDVRGKKLYYLKVTKQTNEVLINVGQKTYENIKALEDLPEQPELHFEKNDEAKLIIESDKQKGGKK